MVGLTHPQTLLFTDFVADSNPHTLKQIALAHVPSWSSLTEDDLAIEQLKGGTTNNLFLLKSKVSNALPQKVLVRLNGNGTEKIIDRVQEAKNNFALSQFGLAPPYYGKFTNGSVFGFIEGTTVETEELRVDEGLCEQIAITLAKWHSFKLPVDKPPHLFVILKNWIQQVKDVLNSGNLTLKEKHKSFITSFDFEGELAWLEKEVVHENSCPVGFCHNDLYAGNIIKQKDGSVRLIDFEYSSYNYFEFDIGNFFCEFAHDRDWEALHPTLAQQKAFVATYLKHRHGALPSEEQIEACLHNVSLFVMASHLMWGAWAVFQLSQSDIDWDYDVYGVGRLEQFLSLKERYIHKTSSS
eukprot:GCRY01000164.1.p1 GENE.GCRY01000164.1~~GCRY01000164.1.p1  ORF type:complete len:354 (-),score=80.55 GCRY01000164.1:270-1331(-)